MGSANELQGTAVVDLGDLLRRQRALMDVLGIQAGSVDDILSSVLYKDVLIMLAGEVQEALEPLTLGTKPWKVVDREQMKAHALEELVDTLFLLLEAFELAGLSATDINDRYEDKRQRNLRRAGQAKDIAASKNVDVKTQPAELLDPSLLPALQRAAGMASTIKSRSTLWQAVWDAESMEVEVRSKGDGSGATIEFLVATLKQVGTTFNDEDRGIVAACLRDEMGEVKTAQLLERAEWDRGSTKA